jgi:hypothetical protein
MTTTTLNHVSTRELLRGFSNIKKKKNATIIMDGSRPTSILVPFNEDIMALIQNYLKEKQSSLKKELSILKAKQALIDFESGKTKSLEDIAKKYGVDIN